MALLAGCANYRIGTTLPRHLKTISVGNFANQTSEPNIESRITSAVRKEFQRDGQLKVVEGEEGDILLSATLLSYDVESLLFEKESPSTTRRYRARIFCKIDATERESGKSIVSAKVAGEATFPASGDVVTARRNVLGDVSRNLAAEVVTAVVSAW